MYCRTQELIFKAATSEEYQTEFDIVTKFYDNDLNSYLLKTQLQVLSTFRVDKDASIMDIVRLFKEMSSAQKELLSEVY